MIVLTVKKDGLIISETVEKNDGDTTSIITRLEVCTKNIQISQTPYNSWLTVIGGLKVYSDAIDFEFYRFD